jgi:ribosomal protein L7Ae-like RNA K-turn-binding protein
LRTVKRPSEKIDAEDRLLKGLGLAARAGCLRIGTEAASRAVRKGQAVAVVIAGDAPDYVHRQLGGLASGRSLPYRTILNGDALGGAVGRARVVALAITDESLGRRVLELAEAVKG